jgi:hypothetical protein
MTTILVAKKKFSCKGHMQLQTLWLPLTSGKRQLVAKKTTHGNVQSPL